MSKVQGCMKCVKFLLFIFNFIFWLSGSLVLAVGLWLRFEPSISSLLNAEGAPESFFIAVYILIGAGGVMMLVGFFGCCGAVRESQCLLGSFFASLLVILGAEVAAGVFGIMNKEKIVKDIENFYITSISEESNITDVATAFHIVLHCCGAGELRPSICANEKIKHDSQHDCLEAIREFFSVKLLIIAYMGISIAGVMVIGMIFSMVLCCAIRNNREVI